MVLGRLKSLFGAGAAAPIELPFDAPIEPDQPFYAMGDIHGCYDLMVHKLQQIDAHRVGNSEMRDAPIVFIGDYIDRGPKSAQVLTHLFELEKKDPDRTICIFGNHEEMMIDFIDDPAGKGRRWLRFGGLDTLKSFGIEGIDETSDLEDLVDVSMDFETALGKEQLLWLKNMRRIWNSGNVHCVHAGLDPQKPVSSQKKSTMIWGHPLFEKEARDDAQWVLHGHTIFPDPYFHSGRVATDTGAYKTGNLSVAVVKKQSAEFM